MEIPSPYAGVVETIHLKEGDKVKQGALILSLAIASDTVVIKEEKPVEMPTPAADARQGLTEPKEVTEKYEQITNMSSSRPTGDVYAGPAVRKMAREIGLDLAMVPGTSRSGATIIGGMLAGVQRKTATEFSFFLAMPTMLAATVYDLYRNSGALSETEITAIGIGFFAAFISALFVVKAVLRFVARHTYRPFAWYRIALGMVVMVWLFSR